ncbi:MAG: TIGR04282 family arsenosugar biosynthesis glycosyltransferase [Acidobacteriota bacterium]|nr:TIGR04282 family arsenosugar biosynthesis glycosyltransferase [Acidobacteriota bacterium]
MVYTKPARPGRVKTRLVGSEPGELTAEQAAQLHQAFLEDLVQRLEPGSFALTLAWALDEDDDIPRWPPAEAADEGGSAVSGVRQEGENLGRRLFNGLFQAAREHRFVAAVGSDHPELELATVERAFAVLAAGAPVVLGPAEDGGYYLVAVAREHLAAKLFEDIPWSTGEVLSRTLERCHELGLNPELLPPGADVDDAADLARLERRLAAGEAPDCPRTRRLLESWGRWSPAPGAVEVTR